MTNSHDTSIERAAPDLLTIDEAAAVMRIGRTNASELARRYVDSGGADGLPVRRIGNQLRTPRLLLEDWLGDRSPGQSRRYLPPSSQPRHRLQPSRDRAPVAAYRVTRPRRDCSPRRDLR
jgi:hypothetical protein